MKLGIIIDPIFTCHQTPAGHPERAQRIESLLEAVRPLKQEDPSVRFLPVQRAQEEWILAVHSQRHFERIRSTRGQQFSYLDPDTQAGPDSFETALTAAGSAVKLADAISRGEISAGLLLARPPGHHAETDRAMGFCLFNNIAVAAHWAIRQKAAEKVAIVDFDVHHGNGTQEIFYHRGDVLYLSSHRFPFYPGTGDFSECGAGEGKGTTVNLPLSAGKGDEFFVSLYAGLVVPVLERFQPDLILVSAGYDAHRLDPLGGMEMTAPGFAALTWLLNEAASRLCGGRILYILEGGYHLEALSESVLATIQACLEKKRITPPPPAGDALAYLREARRRLQAERNW